MKKIIILILSVGLICSFLLGQFYQLDFNKHISVNVNKSTEIIELKEVLDDISAKMKDEFLLTAINIFEENKALCDSYNRKYFVFLFFNVAGLTIILYLICLFWRFSENSNLQVNNRKKPRKYIIMGIIFIAIGVILFLNPFFYHFKIHMEKTLSENPQVFDKELISLYILQLRNCYQVLLTVYYFLAFVFLGIGIYSCTFGIKKNQFSDVSS